MATPNPTTTGSVTAQMARDRYWHSVYSADDDDFDAWLDSQPGDDRPQIVCGKCGETHHSADVVRHCFAGATVMPCDDQVEARDEDGYRTWPCGHDRVFLADGTRSFCSAGHEHASMEQRDAEGWDYAEDEYDAAVIARGGREYRPVGPGTALDGRVVSRIFAALPSR